MADDYGFGETARAAKAKADEKKAQAEDTAARYKAAETERMAAAERFIKEQVVPILEQAQSAFDGQGIGVYMRELRTFRRGRSGDVQEVYAVDFQCFDRADPQGFKRADMKKSIMRFEHDGSALRMSAMWLGEHLSPQMGDLPELAVRGARNTLAHLLAV